jgi:hypothetical protein
MIIGLSGKLVVLDLLIRVYIMDIKEQIRYLKDASMALEIFVSIGERREKLLQEIIVAENCNVGYGMVTVCLSGDEKERFTDLARANLARERLDHEQLRRHVQVFMDNAGTIDRVS